jgi:CheY-specific phosphatase CheX
VLKGIALTNRPVLKGMDGTFSERQADDEELSNTRTEKPAGHKPMKNIVRKYGESLVAAGKVSKADADRMGMMLAELDEEGKAELKELADRVNAKAAETEKVELAEKSKGEDAAKQLAELTPRLKALEEQNARMLAERETVAAVKAVDSMMLSETNQKGFPAGKREEVAKLVAEIGTENAGKVAALLSEVVDATGKTKELGTGASPAVGESDVKADMTLAKAKAKDTGKPVHACLAEIYAEREASGRK